MLSAPALCALPLLSRPSMLSRDTATMPFAILHHLSTICGIVGGNMKLEEVIVLEGHQEDRVWHASWSKDGKLLATSGEDKSIRIWTVSTDASGTAPGTGAEGSGSTKCVCIATLEDAQSRTIRQVDWSPDGRMVCSASFDGTVAVWESQSEARTKWDMVTSLEGHDNEVKCAVWSSTGRFIATCGRDKRVWIWEQLDRGEFECVTMLEGHTQDVKNLVWHPSESVLFSCSYDDTIKVWAEDNDDWYCADTLLGHSSTVWALALAPDGRRLLSVSDDLSIKVWHCSGNVNEEHAWQCSATLEKLHRHPIYSVDWSGDDHDLIVTGGGDNALVLCRLDGGGDSSAGADTAFTVVCTVKGAHAADVNCARWNPDVEGRGHLLVSSGDDGLVRLWRLVDV